MVTFYYMNYSKRLIDIVLASAALILLSPIFLMIIFLLFIFIGSPVFFIQERPGLKGKTFKMIKFRTMRNANDVNGNELSDSERLTKFGALLRSSSLDELPELWNVLKGDMSLVGPRPLLIEYLQLYTPEQFRRHEVRPGITGWAQVNGRNAISWEDKFNFDLWYVDNQSILLDMKILWLTIRKVLKRDGINAQGHVTTEKFKGIKK